mmetsp:Transcript_43787/g.133257  ORF Transcript_43787/g.133257 Transcript_43787/m.133257 type:complete len:215 (+) Transcript_43787:76-720(+)
MPTLPAFRSTKRDSRPYEGKPTIARVRSHALRAHSRKEDASHGTMPSPSMLLSLSTSPLSPPLRWSSPPPPPGRRSPPAADASIHSPSYSRSRSRSRANPREKSPLPPVRSTMTKATTTGMMRGRRKKVLPSHRYDGSPFTALPNSTVRAATSREPSATTTTMDASCTRRWTHTLGRAYRSGPDTSRDCSCTPPSRDVGSGWTTAHILFDRTCP